MMAAVLYWVRADLRQRRWAAFGLVALVAVAMVVPLTAAAAARRTDSSVERMRSELKPYHADVQFESEEGPPDDVIERLRTIPGVEEVGEAASLLARLKGSELDFAASFGQGPIDQVIGTDFERPRLHEGRLPRSADEVLVSSRSVAELGVAVGDEVVVETLTWEGLEAAFGGSVDGYDGPQVPLRVVGIGDQPESLTAGAEAASPSFVVAPAFFEAWAEDVAFFSGIYLVRLSDGQSAGPAFSRAVQSEFADHPDVSVNLSEEQSRIDQTVDAQALALVLLAIAAGVAAVVSVGQAAVRHALGTGADLDVLAAVGASRRQRAVARTLAALVSVLSGSLIAVLMAVVASAWFPTGAAGRVEPDPGIDVDLLVLGGGSASAVAGLALALAVTGSWAPATRARSSLVARRVRALGASVAVVAGVRSALEPGAGSRSVPVRSAIWASVAGVAGVLAAVVFGASLARLVDSPDRFGFNWDVAIGVGDELTDEEAFESAARLRDDPRIESAVLVRINNAFFEGTEDYAFATTDVKGDLDFTVVAGRTAEAPGEVALGRKTMDSLDTEIGDTIRADAADGGQIELRVVGQALFPVVENDDPAQGVSMTLDTYKRLRSLDKGFPDLYVGLVEGATVDEVRDDLDDLGFITEDVTPAVITNLRGVSTVPYALAAFLAALGLAAVAHAVLTALRRRRAELAVLKTLGFVRREVAMTVTVQAMVYGVIGLMVGLPLGFGVGMQAWRAAADGLGFATDVRVPGWATMLVPAVLAGAALVAALPARTAALTPAATFLRSE